MPFCHAAAQLRTLENFHSNALSWNCVTKSSSLCTCKCHIRLRAGLFIFHFSFVKPPDINFPVIVNLHITSLLMSCCIVSFPWF